MDLLNYWFGKIEDASIGQMFFRAVLVFITTWLVVRAAGKRVFAKRSTIDIITIMIIGGILGRVITGAAPFLPSMCASAILVILQDLLAWGGACSSTFRRVIHGRPTLLFSNNRADPTKMKKAFISHEDLLEALRQQTNSEDFSQVEKIFLETNGQLTVIKK